MIEVSRSLYRAGLFLVLAATVFTFGCNKKPVASTPPTAHNVHRRRLNLPVTLQADPTTVEKGDPSTLSWSSTDATQLTIAPDVGTVTAQGSTKVTPSASTTYTITASGPGGSASASCQSHRRHCRTSRSRTHAWTNSSPKKSGTPTSTSTKPTFAPMPATHSPRPPISCATIPRERVTIEGHCDERGSTEYNLALGDRRASAVKQYLVSLGISADRLNTVSFGKEKPFCMQTTEDCYQQNRRGHFVRSKQ